MAAYFMGIDIGSSETKGILMDESWKPIHTCTAQHVMETPHPIISSMMPRASGGTTSAPCPRLCWRRPASSRRRSPG